MSIEVSLTIKDYSQMLRWFELAFAKRNSIPQSDKDTFAKITVMSLALIEELKSQREPQEDV
jgi:hypothetical protein